MRRMRLQWEATVCAARRKALVAGFALRATARCSVSRPQEGSPLPPSFQRLLFSRIWDRPFCSLFAPRASANFSGACTAPTGSAAAQPGAACAQRERWCAAGAGGGGGAAGGNRESSPEAVLRHIQASEGSAPPCRPKG
jgi:hypothetical protein